MPLVVQEQGSFQHILRYVVNKDHRRSGVLPEGG